MPIACRTNLHGDHRRKISKSIIYAGIVAVFVLIISRRSARKKIFGEVRALARLEECTPQRHIVQLVTSTTRKPLS